MSLQELKQFLQSVQRTANVRGGQLCLDAGYKGLELVVGQINPQQLSYQSNITVYRTRFL